MDTIQEFTTKLHTDENLNSEYKKLAETENIEAIESFMKMNGVSSEDIEALYMSELSDDELNSVYGGLSIGQL